MDWNLEAVAIPVSDVDRAKVFYSERLGFGLDIDDQISDDVRLVQLTPPGSACSIHLRHDAVHAGGMEGLLVVVPDIHAARNELAGRGVDVGEVQEFDRASGSYRPLSTEPSWNSFLFFRDPDGNGWVVQHRGG